MVSGWWEDGGKMMGGWWEDGGWSSGCSGR